MMMMRLLSAMGIMSLAFGQMRRVALRPAAATTASTHPIHMRSLGISLYYTQRCKFRSQEVRENSAFSLRSPRGFPLSVWRFSRNSRLRILHY